MPKRTCTIPECGRDHEGLGYCNMHYQRLIKHGDPYYQPRKRNIDERFWAFVERGEDSGCWLWTGATDREGYGRFGVTRRVAVYAHRWAYERYVAPIPDGFVIDHVKANGCTRRNCVNFLRHLEPVTPSENTLRMWRHGTLG